MSFAWSEVTEDIIENSFERCGISNALDGSENCEINEKLAEAVGPSSPDLNVELLELLCDDDNDDEEEEESFDGSFTGDAN